MFMGEYRHTVDPKGRLIIPSKFRELLGGEFVVTRGLDGCLFVYPMNSWEAYVQQLQKLPLTDKNARLFTRFIIAGATTCEHIEIWNEELWKENADFSNMDVIAEHLNGLGSRE